MKSDAVAFVLLGGTAFLMSWWIRNCMKLGEWRYKGGILYRNKSPRLFLGTILFAWTYVAVIVLTILMAFDHKVICGGHGIPRDCLAEQLQRLRN